MEHKDASFITHDNTKLRYQAWLPPSPQFLVLYLHGAAAHSGEAQNFAEFLLNEEGATFALDQRGWGKSSDMKAGHIKSGDDVIKDVLGFREFILTEFNQFSDLPLVLAGHSMGGLIALRTLIGNQEEFSCAVISSPWIGTRAKVPAYVKLFSGLINVIMPKFSDDLNIKLDELTHDNKMITQYYKEVEDGLRRTHGTVRWYKEMEKFQKTVAENARDITLPVLIMQAGQDLLVKESSSKDVYNDLGTDTADKMWQYYPQFYHECWNEVKRNEESLPQVASFIKKHLAQV